MKHLVYVIRQAVRHPVSAFYGVREFRLDLTTHTDDYDRLESYDAGRELAHMATFRRYDQTVY